MAHTQGPWHITDGDTDYEAFGIYADHTALTNGVPASLIGWVAANGWDEDRDNAIILDEDRANATLIAAAPELLAALKDVVRWATINGAGTGKPVEQFWHAWDHAKATIAKATQQEERTNA